MELPTDYTVGAVVSITRALLPAVVSRAGSVGVALLPAASDGAAVEGERVGGLVVEV